MMVPGSRNNDNPNANVNVMTDENRLNARNFRDYKVWQDAVEFSTYLYKIADSMPWFEKKGLCGQVQRAAVSIASNIAEGAARPSDNDFAHFLDISLGSAFEVETQLLIAKNIAYIDNDTYNQIIQRLSEIERQLHGLINKIRKT